MQAAQTIQIAQPKIPQALIEPIIPTGIALWAFLLLHCNGVESNEPIVQIAGNQLKKKDQAVP